jgi:Helix-turn-helix domain
MPPSPLTLTTALAPEDAIAPCPTAIPRGPSRPAHADGQPPEEPPPAFPITSQIEGELRELRVRREKNWIAAHIRERRHELDLTQQEVARRAGTSHSFISKLEEYLGIVGTVRAAMCWVVR